MDRQLSFYSFNVNGIRAAEKKGLLSWLLQSAPTFLGMQEVRAEPAQMSQEARTPQGYISHFVAAQRAGYSGVGVYAKEDSGPWEFSVPSLDALSQTGSRAPTARNEDAGAPQQNESFDAEGRVVLARRGRLLIANCYFPNGNGKNRDNSRVPYKLEFYARLKRILEEAQKDGMRVIVMGDWNTAHRDVDLARPKQNRETSGFLPEECEAMDAWIRDGWIDTFREFCPAPEPQDIVHLEQKAKREGKKKAERDLHPGEGKYTWWSQRFGVREKNIGWRIDYILASPEVRPFLRNAAIHPEVTGSDHCPISVTLDSAVFGAVD